MDPHNFLPVLVQKRRTNTDIPKTFSRFLFISGPKIVSDQILPCQDLISSRSNQFWPFIIFALIILIFFIYRAIFYKKRTYGERILFFHFLILFCGLIIFNIFLSGYFFEWTLVIFFPGFAFIAALFSDQLLRRGLFWKVTSFIFLIFFALYNLKSTYYISNKFGLSSKAEAVKVAISQIGDNNFSLDSIGSCYAQGYMYLFWFYGKMPSRSYADDMFSGNYYQKATNEPDLKVVMVNPSRKEDTNFYTKYNSYKSKAFFDKQVNEIEVLLLKKD